MPIRYDAGEVITAMVTPMDEKREIDYNKNKIKYFEDKLKGG